MTVQSTVPDDLQWAPTASPFVAQTPAETAGSMTVTVQVTLPRPGATGQVPSTADLSGHTDEAPGGAVLATATRLAERLHTIASTSALELTAQAGVSTTISVVMDRHGAMSVAGLESPAPRSPAFRRAVGAIPRRPEGPATRSRSTVRLPDGRVPPIPDGPDAGAPGAAHPGREAAPLQILTARHEALLGGDPLVLTRREYELLLFLAGRPGRVFTRPQLLKWVWGHDVISGERTVDVHVRRLRSKLADGPVITTVRGIGYRLDQADRVAVC
jgi:hypothetical protein